MRWLNVSSILLGAAVIVGVEGASNIFVKPVRAATFDIANETGFTGEALSDLNYALDRLSPQINSPVPITVSFSFKPLKSDDPNAITIGGFDSSQTKYEQNPPGGVPNFLYPAALYDALTEKTNFQAPDISIIFNNQANWYYGIDPTQINRQSREVDFISTVQHEVAHGLGFGGTAEYDEKNRAYSLEDEDNGNLLYIYDHFVVNGSGQPITSFANNSEELGAQLTSDNLFFNGPNAIAANGGTPPKLYAPSDFVNGSSYSHLDQETYDTPGSLNADLVPDDPSNAYPERQLGPITLGILADEGWSVNQDTTSVPEPMPLGLDTIAIGVLGIGYILSKRRKQKKLVRFPEKETA